ncbi:C4-dicarboxylate-specific signal transduction histidine kinase [Bradyrhizobium sp. JR7.2]|uniref:hypothetical protein n=1 Tax=unclassified Bradyrhizobium TaxID=2631580 RepID=UPI003390EDD4
MANMITRDALPILGDHIQLQQVILNLVVNGMDAMKDAYRKPHHQHPDFAPSITLPSYLSRIAARAFPRQMKAVFEPFFISKTEGMGMGLSIAARYCFEAHSGQYEQKNGITAARCSGSDFLLAEPTKTGRRRAQPRWERGWRSPPLRR